MIAFILWYLAISLIGLIAFPLAFRLLPGLPDRGYALSRALGLLLWGYFFWLFAVLGVINNNIGGILLALMVVVGLSIWAGRKISRVELRAWWDSHRGSVLIVEGLFLIAFAGWALVRAANPEIANTEKPMELAFINAILRSPTFPPNDPWLSGYAISYYYFGYVLVAMLAKLTAVPGGVAFNLGISLVFGLSAVGAYGIVYNLLRRGKGRSEELRRNSQEADVPLFSHGTFQALLGPVMILIVSNLEGFLEMLHARGLFSGGGFWAWLGIPDINQPPAPPFTWTPRLFGTGGWWWWRASRVVQDHDLLGGNKGDVIDEFPFFSYLLADLHPHVLAMPFALLAIGLALNLFMGGGWGQIHIGKWRLHMNVPTFGLAAVVLGGMAFLNTWDFPIYLGVFCGAYILIRVRQSGWRWGLLGEFLGAGLALGLSGILLYLPFYFGFSSQAGGFLPNLIYPTRGAHLWVMFGPFFVILFAFLVFLWRTGGDWQHLKNGMLLSLGIAFALFLLALLFGLLIVNLPFLGDLFLSTLGGAGLREMLFPEALRRRIVDPGGWITLVLLTGLALGFFWPRKPGVNDEQILTPDEKRLGLNGRAPVSTPVSQSQAFALLLVLTGGLLVLFPEFFFLRDQFGYRINTIFKFYFQAWIIWGLASAYVAIILFQSLRRAWRMVFRIAFIAVMVMAITYPLFGLWDKTQGFNPVAGLTLDGTTYIERTAPDQEAAVNWLKKAPEGVLVEAVGGQYSEYARIATLSGQPTVLGWPGHESQWRGGSTEIGSRESDVEQIYTGGDWTQISALLDRYDVRYVYIGNLERATYRVNESKFKRFLDPVFQQGQVVIYEVPEFQPNFEGQ